jgi:CO/xanthine dehydrogenase FAD-binding subunit
VAPIPWRARQAEDFLRGKSLTEDVAQRAGEIALAGARPMKDNVYKINMAKLLIQRGLAAAA